MIDHTALIALVRQRIADKRVLALVKAFLKAGVMTTTRSSGGDVDRNPAGRDLTDQHTSRRRSVTHAQIRRASLIPIQSERSGCRETCSASDSGFHIPVERGP
jgi:hypothetical protein